LSKGKIRLNPNNTEKELPPKGTLEGKELKEKNLKKHLGEFMDKRRLLKTISCMRYKFCISR
jgi:hypothetical protein